MRIQPASRLFRKPKRVPARLYALKYLVLLHKLAEDWRTDPPELTLVLKPHLYTRNIEEAKIVWIGSQLEERQVKELWKRSFGKEVPILGSARMVEDGDGRIIEKRVILSYRAGLREVLHEFYHCKEGPPSCSLRGEELTDAWVVEQHERYLPLWRRLEWDVASGDLSEEALMRLSEKYGIEDLSTKLKQVRIVRDWKA